MEETKLNSVNLVGNIASDIDLRTTPSGVSVCKFTVACKKSYKGKDGKYGADFIRCVAWKATADAINRFFSKGSAIGVTGSIETGSYTDKNGYKVYTTEVSVSSFEFINGTSRSEDASEPATHEAESFPTMDEDLSLPFDL